MTMIQANLIPIPRRMARQRQRRVRHWASFCSAYAVLLVIAYGVLQALWGHGDQLIEEDVTKLNEEIALTDKQMRNVAPRLQEARLTLAASLAVGSQPDWSILLALLAREMRENDQSPSALRQPAHAAAVAGLRAPLQVAGMIEAALNDESKRIVLSQCELSPVHDVAPPTAVPGAPAATSGGGAAAPSLSQQRYTLTLAGLGRSQAAISQYVLRLENTGLFSRVTLIESRSAPFGSGEAVSFRIGCTLGESGR